MSTSFINIIIERKLITQNKKELRVKRVKKINTTLITKIHLTVKKKKN